MVNLKQGFPQPPRGWPLFVLLLFYIMIGLLGHEPWKNDDALAIGITFDMLERSHWLTPHIASTPYPDAPLYYWLASLTGILFGQIIPLHDAIRLSSGFWLGLTLWLTYRASRELHQQETAPHEFAIASVLTLAGSLGLLIHAHEAQPMLITLAAHAAAYWAFSLLPRKPLRAACIFAVATTVGLLGNGPLPMLPFVPLLLIAVLCAKKRYQSFLLLGSALIFGISLAALWPIALFCLHPTYFQLWLSSESAQWLPQLQSLASVWNFLKLSLWFTWPALPLSLWALYAKRKSLRQYPYALPLASTLIVYASLPFVLPARSSSALLLLPPLTLLAAAGVSLLRRGAANAFNWFGIMTFSLFSLLVWIGWWAISFGWPTQLAKRLIKLSPGFSGQPKLPAMILALSATLLWICVILARQDKRLPWRGLTHWLIGLTFLWLLMMTLWLPWIEYGRSYRSVATHLKHFLPKNTECISGHNLSDANRALIDYYTGIAVKNKRDTETEKETSDNTCHWLLAFREGRISAEKTFNGWQVITEVRRPGRPAERFTLYKRQTR